MTWAPSTWLLETRLLSFTASANLPWAEGPNTYSAKIMVRVPDSFSYLEDLVSGIGKANESLRSAAGFLIVLDREADGRLTDISGALELVNRLFECLKAFVDSASEKLCVLIDASGESDEWARLVREALTGALLSASREFESIRFRIVKLGEDADIGKALAAAIACEKAPAEAIWRDGTPLGIGLSEDPSKFRSHPAVPVEPGDTVVLTGGGRGITSYLARSLAPFNVKLALLGTTRLTGDPDSMGTLADGADGELDSGRIENSTYPDMGPRELQSHTAKLSKSMEIRRTLAHLRAMGITASYATCDVTDWEDVQNVFASIAGWSGRIAGIVHGAGIIRDRLIRETSAEDFAEVVKVKALGAWNLFQAVDVESLKFFVGLSSISVMGNPGTGGVLGWE